MVKSLCVSFLSMQHSCCGQKLGQGSSSSPSFSEGCLGYAPCPFLQEAAVPSSAPSGKAAVSQQRSHCLPHWLQEGELPPGGTVVSLKFGWKGFSGCFCCHLALCEEPARPPGQAGMSSARGAVVSPPLDSQPLWGGRNLQVSAHFIHGLLSSCCSWTHGRAQVSESLLGSSKDLVYLPISSGLTGLICGMLPMPLGIPS